ncbi:MAG: DUF418 domain-containing protein [Pseudomonadota bacterium]
MDTRRSDMPDILRLIALFGIVVVNVMFIAFPTTGSPISSGASTPADATVNWLVNGLATFKSYGLFSFMFGVGLGFLMRASQSRDLPFGVVYRNRMLGLAALGLMHGCLFFSGDILVIYAVTGSLLYLWRGWSSQRLVRVGVVLLVVQVVIVCALVAIAPDQATGNADYERLVMSQGSFFDVIAYRTADFAIVLPLFLVLQGTAALGWFCLGLAAVQSGAIDDTGKPVWQRARMWCVAPGVVGSLLAAALWEWGEPRFGLMLTLAIAPIATLGYLGLIALVANQKGAWIASVKSAGAASLTVYLGQSIILSTIFSGYGLGLWGAVSRGAAVGIAVGVTVLLMAFVILWQNRFQRGPFEWLLRRITYWGVSRGTPQKG